MSKYEKRGAYHYAEFEDRHSVYRAHVLELVGSVNVHVFPGSRILDVGAGEGLILSKLVKDGYAVVGCDNDPTAVELAKTRGNDVRFGSIYQFQDQEFDVVMLCDVLEHVDNMCSVIHAAKKLAPMAFVAIPDRHDGHALHQVTVGEVLDCFSGWVIHKAQQRHARWRMIFSDPRA